MRQHQTRISVATRGPGLVEVTADVVRAVEAAGVTMGLCVVYCRHTSASLVIQENADPDVQRDLAAFFRRLVPEGDPLYVHTAEGADDMPAHVKSALTQTSLAIPIAEGRMVLGTWQGIYLFEHRRAPHRRDLVVHVTGD